MRTDPPGAGHGHAPRAVAVVQCGADGIGQGAVVADRAQASGHPVLDQLRRAAAVRGHDRRGEQLSLQASERERLEQTRNDQ